ncbi:hypothetical protein [Tropicibacter alexandrii]|uniref:hypothetical protein n=1 Tax=Tropicibacter alexandrii TaxID=2267683 RepID=UPI0010087B94|nr:hypothetical protein [Tropicibacter alexandrii]
MTMQRRRSAFEPEIGSRRITRDGKRQEYRGAFEGWVAQRGEDDIPEAQWLASGAGSPKRRGDELERLLHYMPTIARAATDTWAKGFAASISRQAQKRGWKPTPKQLSMMRRLVSDLFAHGYEGEGFAVVDTD